MDFQLKEISMNKRTARIILHRYNASNDDSQLRALSILLGGYNQYGRAIELEEHQENMKVFTKLLDKISSKIKYFYYLIMKAIINNGKKFGILDGVFTLNTEIRKIVAAKLKQNKARKLLDNDQTLMYELED